MKIPLTYYQSKEVVTLARDLLGKQLFTKIDGKITAGLITETEAYAGITDKASHAFGGRKTKRTEVMYKAGGRTYVYLCYGMHHLFNIVTGGEGVPHAVLIRGIYPTQGIEEILKRRNKTKLTKDISDGPGKLTKALGINLSHNGLELTGNKIWIENANLKISAADILVTKRIGIDYADEDADLPYRFLLSRKFTDKKNAPQLWSAI